MAIEFGRVTPVLRIFDEGKAREFYIGFLGFKVDWEHRFEPGLPLYMQVSRSGLHLHLSEHHGDCTPGSIITVETNSVDDWHAELIGKKYKYNRPGIDHQFGKSLTVVDPFQNRIRFFEEKSETEGSAEDKPA